MFRDTKAFSTFSVDDIDEARAFYGKTLDLEISEAEEGIELRIAGGGRVFIYSKPNHTPASFTVLNFPVDDLEKTVDALHRLGVLFQHYDEPEIKTDEQGIHRSDGVGPNIAWFKDPAGNILSVLEED